MATIGNSAGHKIYVVHSTYPIPANDSVFIDYTSRFVQWRVSHKLSNLAMFTGKAALNPLAVSPSGSGTIADDIKANNYLYVMSGTKLISKFVIGKPIFDTTGYCEMSGVQSSGREKKTFMHRVNTHKTRFDQETLLNIFFDASTYAICADESGDKFLSNFELDSPTDKMSISIDYENRMAAFAKATKQAKREWVISHGDNDTTPYSEGDGVRIETRAGSAGSVKTLILDGIDRNAKISSGTTETETVANQIIVKGKDQYGRQITSNLYDSTRRYITETAATLDGWLAEDCTATDGIESPFTTLKLEPGHGFASVGGSSCGIMYVRIDNELIRCMLSGDELIVWPDGSDKGRGVSVPGLTYCTMPCAHNAGADVILVRDENVSDPTNNYIKLYLQVPGDVFDALAELKVGTEIMRMVSQGNDVWGDYILMWRINAILGGDAYAHSEDMICMRSVYTADDPDSDLNSIHVNGLMSQTFNDNSANNRDALDHKAYSILENKKELTERIAIDVSNPLDIWEDINHNERSPLGSKVTLAETDKINLPAGGYRIVEYEYSWPTPKLILYLNSNDIRIYATGSYDFVEAFDEAESPKRQEPSRSSILLKESVGIPGEDSYEMFGQKVSNIITPREAWDEAGIDPAVYLPTLSMSQDAANSGASVGYVMALSGGGTGSAYWENLSGNDLSPKASYDVIPFSDSVEDLGKATKRWDKVYADRLNISSTASGAYSTFQAMSASGIAVVEIRVVGIGDGDVLRVGFDDTIGAQLEGWNLRVNKDTVGIYNGPLMFQHENPVRTSSPPLGHIMFYSDSLGNWSGIRENSGTLQYTENNGTTWTNFGGGTGYWEITGADIQPTASYDLLPYSGGNDKLGSSSKRWDSLYLDGHIYGTALTLDSTNDLVLEFYSQELTFQNDIIYPDNTGQLDLGNVTHAFNDIFSSSINVIDTVSNLRRGYFEPYSTSDAIIEATTGDLYFKDTSNAAISLTTLAAGGSGYWGLSGSDLKPVGAYHVLPHGSGQNLGQTGTSATWNNLYLYSECHFPYGYIKGDATAEQLDVYCGSTKVVQIDTTLGTTCGRFQSQEFAGVLAGESIERITVKPNGATHGAVHAPTGDLYLDGYSSVAIFWNNQVDYLNFSSVSIYPNIANKINIGHSTYPFLNAHSNKFEIYNAAVTKGYISNYSTNDMIVYASAGDLYFRDNSNTTPISLTTLAAGGGGTSYWELTGADIRPKASYDLLPYSSSVDNLGSGTVYWDTLWVDGRVKGVNHLYLHWDSSRILGFEDNYIFGSPTSAIELGALLYPFLNVRSNKFEVQAATVSKGYLSTISTNDIRFKSTVRDMFIESVADIDIDAASNVRIYSDDTLYIDSNDHIDIDWGPSDAYGVKFDGDTGDIFPNIGTVDLGNSAAEFNKVYGCDLYGTTNASTCDLAELQFVSEDIKPGDVIELCGWDSDEEKYFMEEVAACKSKPCKHIKYFGMQGKWKKASKGSTKCPSVVSTDPGHIMGSTELRIKLFNKGKMNYVALSGSIPFVYVEGKFTPGDILISAGEGKAMVDNTANSNQIVGYAKRIGQNERCEIWVR